MYLSMPCSKSAYVGCGCRSVISIVVRRNRRFSIKSRLAGRAFSESDLGSDSVFRVLQGHRADKGNGAKIWTPASNLTIGSVR